MELTLEQKKNLRQEIQYELDRLKNEDMEPKDRQATINNIVVLGDLLNNSKTSIISDDVLKVIELGISALGVIVPAALYATFLNRGFKFEEDGVYTSGTMKNLTGKMKPTGF